jgi:hypothetical protein
MTGALHAAVSLSAGDVFTAEFDRLGSVTLQVDGRSPARDRAGCPDKKG